MTALVRPDHGADGSGQSCEAASKPAWRVRASEAVFRSYAPQESGLRNPIESVNPEAGVKRTREPRRCRSRRTSAAGEYRRDLRSRVGAVLSVSTALRLGRTERRFAESMVDLHQEAKRLSAPLGSGQRVFPPDAAHRAAVRLPAGFGQGRRAIIAALCGGAIIAAATLPSTNVELAMGAEAAQAPDPHAVQPERPTLATHAHTVAPGWVEIEAGIERDRFADGSRIETAVTTTKIGLTTRTQFGLAASALRDPYDASRTSGFGDLGLALKWRPLDHAPWIGDFALLPALKLPTGSRLRGTGTGTTDVSLILISSRTIGPLSLDVNAGGTMRSGDGAAAPKRGFVWTAALGIPVAGTLGWAAELYGYPGTTGPSGAAPVLATLFGPTWTPRPWLELDAGAIVPVSGPQPHALYAGLVVNAGSL